jgi:hypothetical protein
MQKSLKRVEKRDADYRVALSRGKPWGMDYLFMVNADKGDSLPISVNRTAAGTRQGANFERLEDQGRTAG